MVLLLKKLYLYFIEDPEAVHYIPGGGGGVQRFPGRGEGPNANFYRNLITGQYLSQSSF